MILQISDNTVYKETSYFGDTKEIFILSEGKLLRLDVLVMAGLHGLAEANKESCEHDCPICASRGKKTGLHKLFKNSIHKPKVDK